MKTTQIRINPNEHCPECGALLIGVPDGEMCACCGFMHEVFQDTAWITPWQSVTGRGREGLQLLLDEVA